MNTKVKSENQISLYEVLWKVLEQWKMLIIVAIIFAILCSSFMYIRAMKAYSAAQKSSTQSEQDIMNDMPVNPYMDVESETVIQERLMSLPESDREAVQGILQAKESYDEMQQYLSKSVLMKIDPSNRHILHMEYSIQLPEEENTSLQLLSSAYSNVLYAPLVETLKTALDSDLEDQYIKELIDVKSKRDISDIQVSSTMLIELTIPEDIDINALSAQVDQVINNQSAKLSDNIYPHSLVLYDNEEYTKADYDLMVRQTDCVQRYTSLTNNLTSLENALSSEQKSVYQAIQNELLKNKYNKQTVDVVQDTKADSLEKPTISVKWAAAGFVLGIIVYIVLYVLYLMLEPRLRSKEELQDTWNIRMMGEVYHYSKKGLKRFANSQAIYNLHHKGKTDVDKQVDSIVNSVDSLCEHMSISSVSFLPVGIPGDVEKYTAWNTTWEKLKERLQGGSLSAECINVFSAVDEMDEKILANAKNVIPVVLSRVTTRQMLNDLVVNAEVYDVNLLGAVFVQQ